jgi:serine/threonine-protein kinase
VGLVIRTNPAAGEEIAVDEFIDVVVSIGVEEFTVPNVVGDTEDVARSRIETQGFTVGVVTYELTVDTEAGIVIDQSPEGGTSQAPNTPVDLRVSMGPSTVSVPDVTGLSAENALLQLQRDGFTNVNTIEEFSAEVVAGFVIRTQPEAEQQVPAGATITIFVSQGPEPVSVPNLVGLSESEANAELNERGLFLVVSQDVVEVSLASGLVGNVAEQDPGGGQTVALGAEVTVKIGVLRQVEVPDLSCLPEDEAEEAATSAFLSFVVIGAETPAPSASDEGKVETQSPEPGEMVDEGTVVEVTVYGPPESPPTSTTSSTNPPPPACP